MQRFVTWFSANKRDLQTALASVAMVLILVYTFWHTAALLASYVTPGSIGWLGAVGIEVAVVALSLRAGAFKKTLAAALVVSAVANLERGARESGLAPDGLTVASIVHIDPVQAFIGVTATALLSILVFRLADIVSHDAQGRPQPSAQPAEEPAETSELPTQEALAGAWKCAACPKTFTTQQALAAHSRTHKGVAVVATNGH